MRYREQGISRLGVSQVWRGALGVNVVGGSLCMDSRLKASLSVGANVLWELEVSGGTCTCINTYSVGNRGAT